MQENLEQENLENIQSAYSQLQKMASELSLAEERERRQIVLDIHDRIGHNLAALRMSLTSLTSKMEDPETIRSLNEISEMTAQTIQETRTLTFEISPPILYEFGLEAALEWLTEQMKEKYPISISWKTDGLDKPLEEDARVVIFRAVRELLFNVVKHANAQHATVHAQKKGEYIHLDIEDDGVGFPSESLHSSFSKKSGLGLFWIRHRIDYMGGMVTQESIKPSGSRVTLIFPLATCTNSSLKKIQEIRDSLPKQDVMTWTQSSKPATDMSSPNENKAVLQRMVQEVWGSRRLQAVDDFFSPDFIFHSPAGETKGLESYKKMVQMLFSAFPDISLQYDDILAEGSRVAGRGMFTGTHQGTFMGILPTGRQVQFIGMCIFEFSQGKIMEEWSCPDNLGLIQQIS